MSTLRGVGRRTLLSGLLVPGLFLAPSARGETLVYSTVVIDAGHGGVDPGTSWNGLVEKHLNLDTAKRLEKLLQERGLRTVMTRTRDRTMKLEDRARLANRYASSIYVCLHYNANLDRSVAGFETFYRSAKGQLLAEAVQEALDAQVKGIDRGATPGDFKVLRETRMPAILIECGFISNATEAKRCASATHRQALAEAIADGLLAARRK